MRPIRRWVIGCVVAVLLGAVLSLALLRWPDQGPAGRIVPGQTPIHHVVVIMKENHAFDNYFGTFPGVDGIPANVSLLDGRGGTVSPHWINGSSTPDIPHSREAMIAAWNGGANDGFAVVAETAGEGLGNFSVGYYDDRQLPYYWSLAREFAISDRYFTPMFGPTIPNRLYSIAGTNGGLTTNAIDQENIDLPTIFDQLEARGISWRYYYSPFEPYFALLRYFPHINASSEMVSKIVPMNSLLSDVRSGDIAQVTYIDPAANATISEHAPGNVTMGEEWTRSVVETFMSAPQWASTAILLTMDESGGFYDHVPPPQVDEWGYAFRIPFTLVSPYAKRMWIDHTVMDHTSILQFIARNWDLPPLTARQANAADLSSMFDFPDSVYVKNTPLDVFRLDGASTEHIQSVFAEAVPRKVWAESGIDPL